MYEILQLLREGLAAAAGSEGSNILTGHNKPCDCVWALRCRTSTLLLDNA